MIKQVVIIFAGFLLGIYIVHLFTKYLPKYLPKEDPITKIITPLGLQKKQAIGFLPYWLTSKADKDYTKYLTTLTYFGLTIKSDGRIQKYTKPGETEPGWYTLKNGKMDAFFDQAKKNNILLSLLIFSSDEDTIGELINDPASHAKNLVSEINPLMKQYSFTDLNLDIESVRLASPEARQRFTAFVKEVKKNVDKEKLGTLTVDASPTVLIKNYLINLNEVGKIADYIVLMTYDFHYPGSYVTGPVAPIGGTGIEAEYDSETSIKEALNVMSPYKILLGVPLYGYEWETLRDKPRSAVIPVSGLSASNRRVEEFIKTCRDCNIHIDNLGKESYLIYKDRNTGTFHQIFYPDIKATSEKVKLANQYQVGGIALWALGYEGDTILNPLKNYK